MRRLSARIQVAFTMLSAAAHAAPIASSNFDDGVQGWALNVSTIWQSSGGNSGGRLFGVTEEKTNTSAAASAPAAFLGDWSIYDGSGSVSFDFIRLDNGAQPAGFLPVSITISGPGGSARWDGPVIEVPGPWQTYTAPIEEAAWTIVAGNWTAILEDLTSLTIPIELVINSASPDEQAALDNVLLKSGARPCPGDTDGDLFVGFADLNAVISSFNTALGEPGHNAAADIDGDDFVGFADLNIVLSAFNTACR